MVIVAQYQKITTPTLVVGNVTTTAGTTALEIPVNVINNPGISSMTLNITYDETVMSLTRASTSDALSGLSYTKPKTYKSGCNLVWYGSEPDEIIDGEAFVLKFDILDTAALGNHTITLSVTNVVDVDINSFELQVVDGVVTIVQ